MKITTKTKSKRKYLTKNELLIQLQEEVYTPFDHVDFFKEHTDLVLKFIRKNTLTLVVNEELDIPEEWQYKLKPEVLNTGVKREFTLLEKLEWIKCAIDPIYFIKKYVKINTVDKGITSFKPFKYQSEMVKLFEDYRFVIACLGRQLGKTQIVAGYILHYSQFKKSKSAAILANKDDTAKEILERIQQSYELLPLFLKCGIRVYNKKSMTFENRSKIFSAASSKSAIRGKSCVVGETKIKIRNKKTGLIEEVTMDELRNRLECPKNI